MAHQYFAFIIKLTLLLSSSSPSSSYVCDVFKLLQEQGTCVESEENFG